MTKLFGSGPNNFGEVQIRFFWTNFYNLYLSKMILTQPKQNDPTKTIWMAKNHFGPIKGQGILPRSQDSGPFSWSPSCQTFCKTHKTIPIFSLGCCFFFTSLIWVRVLTLKTNNFLTLYFNGRPGILIQPCSCSSLQIPIFVKQDIE